MDGADPKVNVNSLMVGDNHPWSLEFPLHQAQGLSWTPALESGRACRCNCIFLHALYLIRVPSVDLTLCHFDSLLPLSRPGLSIILEPAC